MRHLITSRDSDCADPQTEGGLVELLPLAAERELNMASPWQVRHRNAGLSSLSPSPSIHDPEHKENQRAASFQNGIFTANEMHLCFPFSFKASGTSH